MKPLGLAGPGDRLSVLCIGAHSDDIEIGAGATILGWIDRGVRLDVHWAVLGAIGPRADEARASAQAFLANAASVVIDLADVQGRVFPLPGSRHQDLVRGSAQAHLARCDPVPLAQRCASGSPRSIQTDVEYLSRPYDPRIRDPEVGRRHWSTEYLPSNHQGAAGAQDKASPRPFQLPALEGLVRRTRSSWA